MKSRFAFGVRDAGRDSVHPSRMEQIDFKKLRGWPFLWVGGLLSVLYVAVAVVLFGTVLSQVFKTDVGVDVLGNAFSGLFSPLALIWVIVGILQQGKELQVQVQELKESVEAQRAMAKASGGQEKLQSEQFLERLYRIYKHACEDICFQLLENQNLKQRVVDGRGGIQYNEVVHRDFVREHRSMFERGNRAAIFLIAAELNRALADAGTNKAHAEYVVNFQLKRVRALSEDFLAADKLRREVLAQFEGGDVLGRVDLHEGFEEARKLADAYSRLGRS